jgi:peptidyl-prolyl cis-trans isomerase A (cyclophilin A)
MKLTKKAIVSVLLIFLFAGSGFVVLMGNDATPQGETVVFLTTMGNFEIQVDRTHAPVTAENFIKYVKAGFYNGTVFHRIMPGFVVQGGGFTSTGEEKTTSAPIKLESTNGLSNAAGTVAMARTNSPDSATSQFYVNLVDNTDLNYKSASSPGYAVFGRIVSGMEVINKIAGVETGTRDIFFPQYNQTMPFTDWPLQDVVVTGCYVKP